ncbi:MAG: hypothetical protein P4L83_21120 [Nevskia sp.]|nr:hypothetical protein [Nevskia sp.]
MPTITAVNTASIALGASVSGAVQLNGQALRSIAMPSGWDAAVLTFQASEDGANWLDLYDENGAVVTLQTAAARRLKLPHGLIDSINWLRVRSGTPGATVTQTVQRDLVLISRAYV